MAPAKPCWRHASNTVTATASPSGLPVAFTIDASAASVCSVSGATVSFIGAGTCVINANQAGNTNYNAVPWDDQPPQNPSGLRLGSPAMTTRGFREAEFRRVAEWIARVVESGLDEQVIAAVAAETRALCEGCPMP